MWNHKVFQNPKSALPPRFFFCAELILNNRVVAALNLHLLEGGEVYEISTHVLVLKDRTNFESVSAEMRSLSSCLHREAMFWLMDVRKQPVLMHEDQDVQIYGFARSAEVRETMQEGFKKGSAQFLKTLPEMVAMLKRKNSAGM